MDTSRYARPVVSIAAMTAAVILFLSCVSWHPGDQPGSQVLPAVDPPANWLGRLGAGLAHPLQYWFGPGCYVLLTGLGVGGLLAFHRVEVRDRWLRIVGVLVLTAVVSAAAAKLGRHEGGPPVGRGGVLGTAISASVLAGFGGFFSVLALLAGFAVGVIVVADDWLQRLPGGVSELARSIRSGSASEALVGLSAWVRPSPSVATATAAELGSTDAGSARHNTATAGTEAPHRAVSHDRRAPVRDAEDLGSDSGVFEALDSDDDTVAAGPLPTTDTHSRAECLGLDRSPTPPAASAESSSPTGEAISTPLATDAPAPDTPATNNNISAKAVPARETEDYAEAEPIDESDDDLLGPTDHLGAGRPSPRAAAWNQYEHTGSTSGVFDAQSARTANDTLFDPGTTPSEPTTTLANGPLASVTLSDESRKLGLRVLGEPTAPAGPSLTKSETGSGAGQPTEPKPSTGATGLLPILPWKKGGTEPSEKPAVSFAAAMGEFDDLAAAIRRLAEPSATPRISGESNAFFDNEEVLGVLSSGEFPCSQRAGLDAPDGGESPTSTHDSEQSQGDRPVASVESAPACASSTSNVMGQPVAASPGVSTPGTGSPAQPAGAGTALVEPSPSSSSGLYGPAAGGLFDDDSFWTAEPAVAPTPSEQSRPAHDPPPASGYHGHQTQGSDATPHGAGQAPTASPQYRTTHNETVAPGAAGTAHWSFPERELLEPAVRRDPQDAQRAVADMAAALDRVLPEFGVEAHVVGTDSGPVVTLFELELAPGVKVAKLSALEADLARALRAPSARVVSPLPGRSTVGLEVPNSYKDTVRLVELLDSAGDELATLTLPLLLGKDAAGRPLRLDLADLPHLLVAGATGSGKSVAINSMLLSLLMTRRPEEVRLILVDPKIVELAPYQGIPHLMCPVVSDTAQAKATLEWAVRRMEERYELLAEAGVRHIAAYNQLPRATKLERLAPLDEQEAATIPDRMPYLVLVIDELADLMISSGKDVESHITRLAQKSRAVGIHLILATQRPSVDVVTGLIKANLPARIAFRVASRIDSRTILDQKGADLLLGRGDMLLQLPGESRLLRAQGAFVSEREVTAVTDKLRQQGRPDYAPELLSLRSGPIASVAAGDPGTSTTDGSSGRDELFDQAVTCVVTSGRGSVSLLQRKLGIGYGRASRLIDQMAEAGIVGEYRGANAREVLMSADDWATLRNLRNSKS